MIKVKYYSHSTVLFKINNKFILVDPYFTNNPKLKNYNINKLKKIDYILVTHAHIDHTKDVELLSNKFNSTIISNYEICRYYKLRNCSCISLNFGSFLKLKSNIYIKYVYALHSSSFEDGTYGGNPGGFIIKKKNKTIYIAGDTEIFSDMKNFNFKFNLVILPIGGKYTMDVKTAYIASNLLKCNNIMGIHYNTFNNIKINKKKTINFFNKKNKKIFLLKKYKYIKI